MLSDEFYEGIGGDMKVWELIEVLEGADNPEAVVVIQQQHGPEYYSHHLFDVQIGGHPGNEGPVLHMKMAHMGLASKESDAKSDK